MGWMRKLVGLLGLGAFSQAQSRRAAILLTGHVRTFDLTAPTLYRDVASSTPAYLENCPKAATPVIPAYLRFPRRAPEPKGSL